MLRRVSRMWIVSGCVLMVSSIGIGTARSYLRTAQVSIGEAVRDAVPISFDLKRLQQMTEDLIPEIQANQKVAAHLEVEMEYLEREVEAMQQSQIEEKAEMLKIRKVLAEGKESYVFGGKPYSRQEVERDLDRRLTRYKNVENDIAGKQKLLEAKGNTLSAATEKILEYQHQRDMLVETAEALQAELRLAELAKAGGNFAFDESKLAQAKRVAKDVEKRIRTMQKLIDGERQIEDEIPVEADSCTAVEKFDEYFGKDSQPAAKG